MNKKYEVLIGDLVIATRMSLEMALCLIRGYAYDARYSKSNLDVRIREITENVIDFEIDDMNSRKKQAL